MAKNILFAISSLVLGHATRSLPLINHYSNDNKIFIVSTGNTLRFLKNELKNNKKVKFFDLEDLPPLERGLGAMFYFYLISDSIKAIFTIKKEHIFCEEFIKKNKIDFIISDVRYGFYSRDVPSFVITHQINLILPRGFGFLKPIVSYFQYLSLRNFELVFIPDFKNWNKNLSGKLSHNSLTDKLNVKFIGILSSYKKEKMKQDIDYYFIISGYIKDNKESFIKNLIEQSKRLNGKKVFVLGETNQKYHKIDKKNNIEIYSSVSGKLRNNLMNRAKIVISRSGYTTIMDLVELGKKGLIAPTPNQTEQEYLANYLYKYFTSFDSTQDFDLAKLINKARKSKVFISKNKTEDSLKTIIKTIDNFKQ